MSMINQQKNISHTSEIGEEQIWKIIGNFFEKHGLVHHQLDSFNDYINNGIQNVINDEADIEVETSTGKYVTSFGSVHITSPGVIEEDRNLKLIFPSEARNRDLNYDAAICCDITESTYNLEGKCIEKNIHTRVPIGRTPVMVLSDICNLKKLSLVDRIKQGECEKDCGGYFVIKGNERVIVAQLRGNYNQVVVLHQKGSDKKTASQGKPIKKKKKFSHVAEIRSMSEQTGHSVSLKVMIGDRSVVFSLPYIKELIPVGIVFKALGFCEDKEIIDFIGIDSPDCGLYMRIILRDSYFIRNKEDALKYIGQYSMHIIPKEKRVDYAWQVVESELFPHLGICTSVKEKAMFLGHMVKKLLTTKIGLRSADDRDNLSNKRIETCGILCTELFRTLYKKFLSTIKLQMEKRKSRLDSLSIINKLNTITNGLKHSFSTGNWGVQKNAYIRTGVSQVMSRMTFGATLSHTRRIVIPIGKEGKNTKIRQIHASQFGYICPHETPEGQPAGIVLNFSLLARVTKKISTSLVKEVIEDSNYIINGQDVKLEGIKSSTYVFLNGILIGMTEDPTSLVTEIQTLRKQRRLDYDVSVTYDMIDDEVRVFSDSGRASRPLFTVGDNGLNITKNNGYKWDKLVKKGLIEYVDCAEIENYVIAMDQKHLNLWKNDYMEIHPSMMLGVMGSIIPFSDHSPSPRNCYQCLHSKEPVLMADKSWKNIGDIVKGDKVVTLDPNNYESSVATVINHYSKINTKPIIQITTETGRIIKCTEDHLVLTPEGWKEAKDAHMICIMPYQTIYNNDKYRHSFPIYEYLKYREYQISKIIEERSKISEMISEKYSVYEIANQLEKKESYIRDSIRNIKNNSRSIMLNNSQPYQDWIKDKIIKKDIMFVNIDKKITQDNTIVCDITVDSDNHSFIAGDSLVVHNCSMGKQALGIFATSYKNRTDTIAHVLNYPQRPIVSTRPSQFMGFNDMPSGINAIVAIMSYTGFNQEDSVILNQSAIDRGLFTVTSYRTLSDSEKKGGAYSFETIKVPPPSTIGIKQEAPGYFRRKNGNYSLLDENGVIRVRSEGDKGQSIHVKNGDVIIGKVMTKNSKAGDETHTDCSVIIKNGEEGIIDRVIQTITPQGYKMVKVVIRLERTPEVGDKFASRAAQKGTCGATYRQEDMPFNIDGISPDIIINPHCLTGDTIIEMADGDVEYIKNIFDKDLSIITIDTNTIEKSITKYTNGFMKNTNTLKKITTTSGRTIKCTEEHLMLVRRNNKNQWVKCEDLIPYSDKLFVTHTIIPVSNVDGNDLIIKKESSIYWNRLETLGFVGKIDLCKTKILARLLGALESDGYLQLRNKNTDSVGCMLHLGEMEDYNEVCRDMNTLGFNKPSILKTNNCYSVELEVACGVLLKYLGACYGNKTKMIRTFPKWIKNAHMSVKREFLSGYHSGDSSKVVVNQKNVQQQVKIRGLICRTYNNVKKSHIEYLNCIMSLYKDLNIKTTLQQYPTKYENRTDLMIYYSLTNENIIRISDTIAYRYCNHKRKESIIAIEYLRTSMNGIKFEYKKFINCFSNNNSTLSFVECVTNIPSEPVYDFTTESKNHSFVANGMVSHNCIPSRMTVNQLLETVLGKACVIKGEYGDSTPFTSSSTNGAANRICDLLAKAGMENASKGGTAYERTGWETLYNGMTGEPVKAKVFMGPTYYQRLKHMVSDKMHARANGHVTTLTRQPLEGRSRDGGLRFGEMERDCMIAHGASRFLKESLFDRSDAYQIIVCNKCGMITSSQEECIACADDKITTCNIPYAAKLLAQELMSMGIKIVIKPKE